MKKQFIVCDKCGKPMDESEDVFTLNAILICKDESQEIEVSDLCGKCAGKISKLLNTPLSFNAVDERAQNSGKSRRVDIETIRETDPARAARLEYFREYRAKYKDKVAQHNKNYWEKKVQNEAKHSSATSQSTPQSVDSDCGQTQCGS